MQREFCPCVAWLLHLFVFWVGLKAFFMLCIVAEQDGLQAKKGNMLLTYSGVISHGTVFEKGLCFLCLRVTAEGIFILPECPQLPLSLFMYVCVFACLSVFATGIQQSRRQNCFSCALGVPSLSPSVKTELQVLSSPTIMSLFKSLILQLQ